MARRLASWTAVLLAGATVLYLIGMNVFLRTRLFRNLISADPDVIVVDYTTAYSWWPESIHAEGLSVRGRDSHVEWILRLDRVDLRVSFMDLARKKFHAERVRANGVSMRVRLRADVVTPETMAALPPVPGYPDPPLKDVGPPPPPLTDADYDLWMIELDDVVANHVRELWVETLRYAGDLDIHGRWLFRPVRSLDVGPAVIDVHTLEIGHGMIETWGSGFTGRLSVTVHPLDLQTVEGGEMLHYISIDGDLSGTAHLATAVDRILSDTRRITVARADAPIELHARIHHGTLGPGTQLHAAPFEAEATAAGLTFHASLQADVHVDDSNVGYANLRVATAEAFAEGRSRARATSIATALSSRQLDLAHPFSDTTYVVDVDQASTDSLAYWRSRLAPTSDVELASGTVTASGRLAGGIAEPTGSGAISFGARDLLATRGDTGFEGSLDGRVELGRIDFPDRQVAGTARLAAEHMTARFRGTTVATDFSAEAVVLDGHWNPLRVAFGATDASLRNVHAMIHGAPVVIASLDVRAQDLVVGQAGLAGRVALNAPRVEVPALPALSALLPLGPDMAVESGSASASVRLDVDLARFACNGDLQVATRDLRLRVGSEKMNGDLVVAMRATQNGGVTDLSGSQVELKNDAPESADWWGRARLREATIRLQPEIRIRTQFSAEAKDASPLTALVASNTAIPQWLLNAVSTKQFAVTGEVRLTPSVFALRSVQAHAEGADVGFELSSIRADKDWALLLDLGAVVAGVDVASGKTQVLLFGARPWFQRKVAWLQAAEQRSE